MTLKVAIIILNWENAPATQECARSVVDEMRQCNGIASSHLWIVDNGSGDSSKNELEAWLDNLDIPVSFIANPENLGFSGGMNKGIFAAFDRDRFDYFWLLNNDLIVEPGSLSSLLQSTIEGPDVAIWGSTVKDAATSKIQCAGGCRYNRWLGKESQVYSGLEASEIPSLKRPRLDYIYGAAMFVRGELLERLHGLNEDYFLFYEELDLVKQLRLEENIGWCIDSNVVHKGGGSSASKVIKTFAAYHAALSAFKFTRRYYPYCLPTVVMSRVLGLAIHAVHYRNPELALAPLRAFRDLYNAGTQG
ncbi:glycosyltransferase [Pseudomonadota bacterium]